MEDARNREASSINSVHAGESVGAETVCSFMSVSIPIGGDDGYLNRIPRSVSTKVAISTGAAGS